MDDDSVYTHFILKNVPRVLTQIDRDIDSPTFGCCDRNYWLLKIRDFPSAVLQQSCLTLAGLYDIPFKGNIYYRSPTVFDTAIGTLKFWKKIQLNDGSFSEYYPNEHAIPPSAFSLFCVAETYRWLNVQDETLLKAMVKTADFLINNKETKASNQEIASVTALCSVYMITGREELLENIETKLSAFLSTQSNDGFFPEHGGADIGYLSVTLDMLGEYYWCIKDKRVADAIRKIVEFLKYFIGPDGTCGGEYGSRDTKYCLPNGLEVAAHIGIMDALDIKQGVFRNVKKIDYYQNGIDDRYMTHYVLHSFIRALKKEQRPYNIEYKGEYRNLPSYNNHKTYFPEAKLFTIQNGVYYAVVACNKHGVIKIYDCNKEVFADFGYRILRPRNIISTTSWLDPDNSIKTDKNSLEVSGRFSKIKIRIPSVLSHITLRLLAVIVPHKMLTTFLKNKLIYGSIYDNVSFRRKIIFQAKKIIIEDDIESDSIIDKLKSAHQFSQRVVPSAKFFSTEELLYRGSVEIEDVRSVSITHVFDMEAQIHSVEIKRQD